MPDAQSPSKNFDPVQAGRLGLWLLSLRSHKAAQKRVAVPERVWKSSAIDQFRRLIMPWHVYEYPGAAVMVAHVCKVARATAENWLKGSKPLPYEHALRLAQYLEQHASECEALAREMRAYEKTRRSAKKKR